MHNLFNTILLSLIIFTGSILITNKIINIFFYKKKKMYFYKISKEIFSTLLIIFTFRSFIYEPFQIPSASMMPTLLIGDLILVNKFKYNLKNPINNKIILNINEPKYGDIIVFKYPKNEKIFYIKRIVGLPNDIIIYDENINKIKIYKLFIKNKKKYYYEKNIFKYSNEKNSNFLEEIVFYKNKVEEYFWKKNKKIKNKNSKIIFLKEKTEYINNTKHNILLWPKNNNINKNIRKIYILKIPKNMYFVLGDYRDNSEDSRYWGCVHKNLIIGKAEYIWMSLNKQENNLPNGFRFERIGKIS